MELARSPLRRRITLALALAATAALSLALTASANVAVTIIATDPFTNSTSQHKTVVEPDSFFFGSTGVAAAQSGRFTDGGASGIVFARSVDNGSSYTSGTTTFPFGSVSGWAPMTPTRGVLLSVHVRPPSRE